MLHSHTYMIARMNALTIAARLWKYQQQKLRLGAVYISASWKKTAESVTLRGREQIKKALPQTVVVQILCAPPPNFVVGGIFLLLDREQDFVCFLQLYQHN